MLVRLNLMSLAVREWRVEGLGRDGEVALDLSLISGVWARAGMDFVPNVYVDDRFSLPPWSEWREVENGVGFPESYVSSYLQATSVGGKPTIKFTCSFQFPFTLALAISLLLLGTVALPPLSSINI